MVRSKSIWKIDRMQRVKATSCSSDEDGADRELPFEAEPEIEEDAEGGDRERDHRGLHQFLRHRRADHFDPAQFDALAELGLDLASRPPAAPLSPPGCSSSRIIRSFGGADFLDLHVAQAQARRACRAAPTGPARLDEAHFDQRAAAEIDAEIEAERRQQADGERRTG